MGHDISPIGNHTLNTKNLEELARDISSRLNININIGYFGREEHFRLLGSNKQTGNIIINQIINNPTFKTYSLIDESYQLKELHNKFGDDIFYNPDYWAYSNNKLPSRHIILEEKKGLIHPNYSLTLNNDNDLKSLTINKDHYGNHIPYYSRWWSFCDFFIEKEYKDKTILTNLNDYRKELMNYTLKLGGDKMYYLDDQNKELKGVGGGSEWEIPWKKLEDFVIEKTSKSMLDIPRFMTDKDYRKEFHKLNEYPLSFIDHFCDIK